MRALFVVASHLEFHKESKDIYEVLDLIEVIELLKLECTLRFRICVEGVFDGNEGIT